ncbi:MAG: UDP-N-acetylmuramate--L-alanine ligase [Oscillospiraceae bacterium]|nr:UDP-N-acetylmuramate--L-alanine ligase [Oscillospiraceae bacterium]
MNHIQTQIQQYITPGRHAHMVGIGGVSMSSLAEVLLKNGMTISGSDWQESAKTEHLRELGISISIGAQMAKNIIGADCVIRTAAAGDDNPEVAAALAAGIPVFERAQAWGAIMQRYENAVCIAGTHGKTTTTSMTTHIFMAAQTDPTVMIGGTLPLIGSDYRVGKGNTIILESCEYCNSFLYFFPTIAVVMNVEEDHLDFFKDLDDIKASFRRFAALAEKNGRIVGNADDDNTMDALAGLPVFTFGIEREADLRAENLVWDHGMPEFDMVAGGKVYAHLRLKVGGMHNVYNALAAAASAYLLGIDGSAVKAGLETFTGAGRRFEYKGELNGAKIYDDYSHHPSELHALFSMVKSFGYERIVCAFQPHTYTRTKALFDDFVEQLGSVDQVILSEIFAAREKNTIGISSRDLAEKIPGAVYCPTLEDVADEIRKTARPGDLILTVGAGNIVSVADTLTR